MPISVTIQQFQGGSEVINLPQYLTKHFDEYLMSERLKDYDFIEQTNRSQPWQQSDTIKLQYESNYSPINVSLIDCNGETMISLAMTNVRSNMYMAGYYIFEMAMALASVPQGCYFLKRTTGDPISTTFISGPLSIKTKHPRTILLEYNNSRFTGDVVFETGIVFQRRVPAILIIGEASFTNATYLDQKQNPTLLSSKRARLWNFCVGNDYGISDEDIDKVSVIFTCDTITYDGKLFGYSDDFKIDPISEDGTWMSGANIGPLREGINRNSMIVSTTINTNRRLLVTYNIEGKIFGTLNVGGSNNTTPIKSIE